MIVRVCNLGLENLNFGTSRKNSDEIGRDLDTSYQDFTRTRTTNAIDLRIRLKTLIQNSNYICNSI